MTAGELSVIVAAVLLGSVIRSERASFAIIYSYGDFTASTSYVRSDDPAAARLEIARDRCVPANRVEAFFKNPFADLQGARTAPLKIQRAVAECESIPVRRMCATRRKGKPCRRMRYPRAFLLMV